MSRINYSSWLTKELVKREILKKNPFCLIDVGASNGIASYWSQFGDSIKAFGFEPLYAECNRLNADVNKPKDVIYFPYFVGSDNPEVSSEGPSQYYTEIYERSSYTKALQLKKVNFIQQFYNHGEKPEYTRETITLDNFFLQNPVDTIDFIKIDTDGSDYKALHGSQNILNEKNVLGILIESQFHGARSRHSNTFRNIDRFLTENGFYLFDIEPIRYTKSDLPGKFVYSNPSETEFGQVLWGEALYLRDYVGSNEVEEKKIAPIKLLKLACIYEIFGLPDCSAELLNKYSYIFSNIIDIKKSLDLLVRDVGHTCKYSEFINLFENSSRHFYPSEKKECSIIGKIIKRLLRVVQQ